MTGMLVVVVSPKGVAGTAADFDASQPGGFTRAEAQKLRARTEAWRSVYRDFCGGDLGEALCASGLAFDSVRNELLRRGWRKEAVAVAYPDPETGSEETSG